MFIDDKTNYTKCVDKQIYLREYSLLLSDHVLIPQKTSFTNAYVAFALTLPFIY